MDRNNNRKPKEKDLRKVLSEGDFHEDYQYDHIEAGNIYEH